MEVTPVDYEKELLLLVDDEKDVADTLHKSLMQVGFKSHAVNSAMEALVKLKENKGYTFLIADIVMPETDGLELIARVREMYPHICIIAMTGFVDQYKYVDVINVGAIDFINKPHRIDELEAKIRRSIIERDMRLELERMCITDPMTELYNQRYFYQKLNDEILRAQRQNRRLSLLFCDLDELKFYNDKYGHLAGDELLKNFGRVMNSQIRHGVDSGFRYGGDEFAIILNDTDPDACQKIRERIARSFRMEYNAEVSIGFAHFSEGMTAEDLIDEADKSLYKLKEQKKRLKLTQLSTTPS